MAGFTESGITLDFSTDTWFRFEKTEPHKSISHFHFKEMDACWLDEEHECFYAIELKDYTEAGSLDESNTEKRKWNIAKKVVDTMQMYLSARYQNTFGKRLEQEKRVDLQHDHLKAKFITIIKVKEDSLGHMNAFKDACLEILRGYEKVWDDVHITVMTYEQAKRKLPFVQ